MTRVTFIFGDGAKAKFKLSEDYGTMQFFRFMDAVNANPKIGSYTYQESKKETKNE